jgi:hypothetical protein
MAGGAVEQQGNGCCVQIVPPDVVTTAVTWMMHVKGVYCCDPALGLGRCMVRTCQG